MAASRESALAQCSRTQAEEAHVSADPALVVGRRTPRKRWCSEAPKVGSFDVRYARPEGWPSALEASSKSLSSVPALKPAARRRGVGGHG